jgi:quercetin dioxygenase-like cupin family protein
VRLSSARRWTLLAEAGASLVAARLSVWWVPFKSLASRLGDEMAESPAEDSHEQRATVARIGRAVGSLGGRLPGMSQCLVQAVAATWMLRRRRIPSTLYIGLAKEDSGEVAVHAWVRSGTQIVTGAQTQHDFSVVTTFARPGMRSSSAVVLLLVLLALGCGWKPNTDLDPPTQVASGSDVSGTDSFYGARLREWENRQETRSVARTSLHDHELTWTSTAQDARIALLVSPETGFDTWGLETAIAEIPPGWHTGRHRHGEAAIYVVAGEGFISVDGVRYDIFPGTTVGVPFGAEHQLFNLGSDTLRYFVATAYPLLRYLGLFHLEQLEEHGPTTTLPSLPVSVNGFDDQGRRIRLLWEEAKHRDGAVGLRAWLEARLRGGADLLRNPANSTPGAENQAAHVASGLGHHSSWVRLMGRTGQMDFPNKLALISGFLIDDPGAQSGRHAHMEAIIYVLRGQGHSIVDGNKIPWGPGTSLHLQGPQTEHQHFNTGNEPAFLLRIASGLRPAIEESTKEVFPFLWFESASAATPPSSR